MAPCAADEWVKWTSSRRCLQALKLAVRFTGNHGVHCAKNVGKLRPNESRVLDQKHLLGACQHTRIHERHCGTLRDSMVRVGTGDRLPGKRALAFAIRVHCYRCHRF